MAKTEVLVVYYSRSGHCESVAESLLAGVRSVQTAAHAMPVEEVNLDELPALMGLAVGSPAYFSNVAWQIKKFIDETIRFYGPQLLAGKPFVPFATTGTPSCGRKTLELLNEAFVFHHNMKQVGEVLAPDSEDASGVHKRALSVGAKLGQIVRDESNK